jgi:hypothetical protein
VSDKRGWKEEVPPDDGLPLFPVNQKTIEAYKIFVYKILIVLPGRYFGAFVVFFGLPSHLIVLAFGDNEEVPLPFSLVTQARPQPHPLLVVQA